jgi:hypothetical protein
MIATFFGVAILKIAINWLLSSALNSQRTRISGTATEQFINCMEYIYSSYVNTLII